MLHSNNSVGFLEESPDDIKEAARNTVGNSLLLHASSRVVEPPLQTCKRAADNDDGLQEHPNVISAMLHVTCRKIPMPFQKARRLIQSHCLLMTT